MSALDATQAALLFVALGLLVVSTVKLVFAPLAIWFEVRQRLTRNGREQLRIGAHPRRGDDLGGALISVIVPAYNEGVVLAQSVESILRSRYPFLEVIVVDDGSTDDTATVMADLAARHPRVRAIRQANAGKGAALNRGVAEAKGEVFVFVDADGLFSGRTLDWMLVSLAAPGVGAVCGDDRPANPDRPLTQLLSVMSHVGTGLVRRALSLLHCLPIVSGNVGAFRASLIREIGGFREDTIGEDLELTWRIYAAGYRVVFQPRAIVYAESPSTIRGLWNQRVRWARGLLQTTRIHRRLIGNPAHGVFGIFLALNTFSMIVAPPLQLVVLVGVLVVTMAGEPAIPDTIGILGWLGILVSAGLVVLAIGLNGAWSELRHLWTLPLWPIYSVAMSFTMVAALAHEIRGAPARWNKLQRTGVVTDGVLAGIARLDRG
ncbi:MAG TPA: glycosyltransferase family 2 protein [Arachnia sp.]|nr:glycosyltransferase family 2 protein [Arachnia sp.]HMR12793.1 glycosyltransferase family 2 protein [Arachnia sp.]